MADKNTSTLQSYVDSAVGAVQNAVGSLTGNTTDQVSFLHSTCSRFPVHYMDYASLTTSPTIGERPDQAGQGTN
jgi:hypothetical protein